MSQFIVRGSVRQAPAGCTVRAFDRDLRGEESLGDVPLGARGDYEIRYESPQFRNAEKATADLVVRVVGADGAVLAASPVRFNAGSEETIELVIGADRTPRSEYDTLVEELRPLIGTVAIADLREDAEHQDVSFLSGDTGRDPDQLTALIAAHKLVGRTRLAPEGLYALFRRGQPRDLAALAALGAAVLRRDLLTAIRAAIIAARFRDQVDPFVRALIAAAPEPEVALMRPQTLYTPVSQLDAIAGARLNERLRSAIVDAIGAVSDALAAAVKTTALRIDYKALKDRELASVIRVDVLEKVAVDTALATEAALVERRLAGQALPTVDRLLGLSLPLRQNPLFSDDVRRARAWSHAQAAGVDAVRSHTVIERATVLEEAPREAFDAMVSEGVLTAAQATDLHRSYEFGRLTADNAPLMTAMRGREIKSAAELAAWGSAEWQAAIAEAGTMPPGETAASYAAALQYSIEQTYPAAAFAWRTMASAGDVRPHLESLLRANPALDLAATDFFAADSGLDWRTVPEGQRPAVRKQLMTHQRVLALSYELGDAELLMSKGYHSAMSIAATSEGEFLRSTGLDQKRGKVMYAQAKEQSAKTSHTYAGLHDIVKGQFGNTHVGNVYPSLVNDLMQIDGLAELFGPQAYCDCEHCRSILSPAAYFVDLMYFIETYVSTPTFVTPDMTDHPLYLKVRRGDLWTLQLTCENTDTLVPYLTIVNEVLEEHLDDLVSGDIYETLNDPAEKRSTYLPFTLPLEELRVYLGHFGLSLHDVYELLDQPDDKVWRARLGLSPAELAVITVPDPADVSQRFGAPASLAAFPVDHDGDRRGFIEYAGITREQLDDLLALRFHPDLAQITIGHKNVPGELQNFPEILQQLTAARLDFIHRFLRLWRHTGWSITDLDLVLDELRDAGRIGNPLDPAAVTMLAKMIDVQASLSLKVEEICAIAARMPVSRDYPVPPAETADERLFERLFDLAEFFGEADATTHAVNTTAPYHYYSLNTTDPDDHTVDARTPMLLAALSISETDLSLLFGLLSATIGFDAGGDTTLDRDKISVLYRHARLARALKLSVDDFTQAIRLCFDTTSQVIITLDQVATLIDFRTWLKSSPFNVSELRFILRGEESATVKYQSTTDTVATLVIEVQASTEADKLVALADALARSSRISSTQLTDTLAWVGVGLDAPGIATGLAATFTDGVPDDPAALDTIVELSRGIERALSLFSNLKLSAETITYLTGAAAALGIADLRVLALDDLEALLSYRNFSRLGDESEPVLQALLASYQAAQTFSDDDRDLLADLWQQERSLIDSLLDSLVLPAVPIDALTRLSEVLDCCKKLGVNGFSLQKLADDSDFAHLSEARDVALGAFSSKYADEADRTVRLEPYQDQVNVLTRDALCDFMIARQVELKFKDRSDIYAYFLLDVEMSGCFRTSRIVCANGSLQLYVQRCLLNLEQSDPELNPDLPDVKVDLSLIPADEWDWRKNYRVWEANRKVFLYPENYIEPDLRDNKSPIFEEMEGELLAEKITIDTAEAAYRRYMKRFAELTRLKLGGTYRDADTSTYHFFAHTQQDPPQYYHRTWDGTTWAPWEKIDLGIKSAYVAAVSHLGKLYLFWPEGRWKQKDTISGGSSQLDYYEVEVNLGYSHLDEHGKWIPVQKLPWLFPSEQETISAQNKIFDEDDLKEMLLSKNYQKVYPRAVDDSIVLRYHSYQLSQFYFDRKLDLFNNRLRGTSGVIPDLTQKSAVLLAGTSSGTATLVLKSYDFNTDVYFDKVLQSMSGTTLTEPFSYTSYDVTDVTREDVMHMVHSGYPRVVFTFENQQYLIRTKRTPLEGLFSSLGSITTFEMVRLSTSLANELGTTLFSEGLEAFLSLETQALTEKPFGITITAPYTLAAPTSNTEHLDLEGPYGEYYRELFFHVPFRIASHLNANQMFEDAKWWYERIFDPTASEAPGDEKPTDRNWRYIEFRDLTIQTMKQILADEAAIEEYKTNPFNPHAIARLRMTAYQKSIVMKYIDNLLDWGDSLFARDTMESINEATMLYVLAADILGKRPAKLGTCATVSDASLTYEKLGPAISKGSEFLIALENWHVSVAAKQTAPKAAKASRVTFEYTKLHEHQASKKKQLSDRITAYEVAKKTPSRKAFTAGAGLARHHSTLAFCIPPNADLLAYWDRVEDRLFKIRNCMNISGVRRSLALFAPVIDPMALVRAVAAGLSLDEALSALAAPVPAYRFTVMIEKAKAFVGVVQSFGGALLSALEKKDAEELVLLRSVHERNILRMTREMKTRALQDSQLAYQSIVEQQLNVQNRIDHYAGLIESGLTGWETAEQAFRHTATGLKMTESIGHMVAGIMYLIPQLGSPFAMKFGGKELGDSVSGFNNVIGAMAAMTVAMAESTALEATFQRREQDWDHQLVLAQQEWKQVEQQRLAAEIKMQMAEQDLAIHDQNVAHADELEEFYGSKFTQLGLYEYMSTTLNRLYRDAYNVAYDVAKMAERAFQFERDSSEIFVAGDNWQFDRAGLLAGERLIVQLELMEKAFLQQNARDYEVNQSFSLALLDPRALLELRETGGCEVSIPEVLFDMVYPGQYRRLIKAVRLTVPCVVGPYTSVGAKLTLLSSKVRRTATVGGDALVDVPSQKSTAIATSQGQSDAGLFELNYRDERYLPFEGAGAISTWRLELPAQTRAIDYDTISDVIVNLSYTAKDDGEFKTTVENQLVDALTELASTQGMFRLLSMRHELSNAFHRLLNPTGDTQTAEFEIGPQHFPYFLRGRDLLISEVTVYLKPKGDQEVETDGLTLSLNDVGVSGGWSTLPETVLRAGSVPLTGGPLATWTVTAGGVGLDKDVLEDLLILVKYGI